MSSPNANQRYCRNRHNRESNIQDKAAHAGHTIRKQVKDQLICKWERNQTIAQTRRSPF